MTDSAPDNNGHDPLLLFEKGLAGTGLAPQIDGRWVGEYGGDGFRPYCDGDRRNGCGLNLEVSQSILRPASVLTLGLVEV